MRATALTIGVITLSAGFLVANAQPPVAQRDGKAAQQGQRPGFGAPGNRPPAGGPPGGGPVGGDTRLVEKFDRDGDGHLDETERAAAREFVKRNPQQRARRGGPPRGFGGVSPTSRPGKSIAEKDVRSYRKRGLYDESILRTFFVEFPNDDWEQELADFYRTDVNIPVTLRVDGKKYPNTGIAFRGNSSYFTLGEGQKRSFGLRLDYVDKKQDLYGYRTLNLLNAHADPSFMREVLYNHIARRYTTAPYANFVRLVVNGKSWGVFLNIQQMNKDFTRDWYGTKGGDRWKVPGTRRGGGRGMKYYGDDPSRYSSYELKSSDKDAAVTELIRVCKALTQTPIEELDTELDKYLNVDQALWFLALDNALSDMDGYHSRGSDYVLFRDPDFNRFHVLPYDSNETFRSPHVGRGPGGPPGGAGGGRQRGGNRRGPVPGGGRPGGPPPGFGGLPPGELAGPGGDDKADLDPFSGVDNTDSPLLNRLLANPRLRARYIAHVRTIANKWLDWNVVGTVVNEYRALIENDVKVDTRNLSSYQEFLANVAGKSVGPDSGGRRTPPLKSFIQARYKFLMNHPEIRKASPEIAVTSVHASGSDGKVIAGEPITISAKAGKNVAEMFVYVAESKGAPFVPQKMADDGRHDDGSADDGVYAAILPALPAGTHAAWYVEARAPHELGTVAFKPEATEHGANELFVRALRAKTTSVVINEVQAGNKQTVQDPQGDYDDWIELHNTTDGSVDLSGMYLTDAEDNPRKWKFPADSKIDAGGYLIVWADEAGKVAVKPASGLHASFKLSKTNESVFLIDSDERGNRILDKVNWTDISDDTSYGRIGKSFDVLTPTPGKPNAG